jgi:hypothetical protein
MRSDLRHHDAFVAVGRTMEDLRRRLEERLGVTFEQHESSFWNGDYDVHEAGDHSEIKIINNGPDPYGAVWFDRYPQAALVVLVDSTAATRHLPEAVAGIDGIVLHEHTESLPSPTRPAGPRGLANDLYGSSTLTARALLDEVAPVLGLVWTVYDGGSPGEEWTATGSGEEDLSLYDNVDRPDPADRSRLRHAEMSALLHVGATARSDELRSRLDAVEGLVHLHHHDY